MSLPGEPNSYAHLFSKIFPYTLFLLIFQVAHLQIWRPIGGNKKYQLVGQTIFRAQWVGHNYVPLNPEFRIPMKKGDVIGLYFPRYNPIPWSEAECILGNEHRFWYNARNIEVGVLHTFQIANRDWTSCRHYSINATVMNITGIFNNAILIIPCLSLKWTT